MTVELDLTELGTELLEIGAVDLCRTPLYVAPPRAAPLRLVMVVPVDLQGWLPGFLAMVPHSPWLEVRVLPYVPSPASTSPRTPVDLRALLRYERRRLPATPPAPHWPDGVEGVTVEPTLPPALDIVGLRGRVAALRPDLVLLAGAPEWAEGLGDRAEWGCWHLDASLIEPDRAAQVLLPPVMRGRTATRVELRLEPVGRPPTTLATTVGSTSRGSLALQVERVFRKIPPLLHRALRQLACDVLDAPRRRTSIVRMCSGGGAIPARAGLGLRTFGQTLAHRMAVRHRLRREPYDAAWHIQVRQPDPRSASEASTDASASLLVAPGELFWADPCIVADQGRHLLFAEQWSRREGKGAIIALELLPGARARSLGVVLDEPFHLSFPQVFAWKGQWYMTVESGQKRRVTLYRADAFPSRWQPIATLVDGWHCVDPTLHHDGRHWYLWATVAESGGSTCDELFLFVADELTGPYRPHPANPIVSDARRARMAGRLFRRDGRLIRPAQDCAPRYGSAVVFNEIVELSPTHYRECPLARLEPDRTAGLDGCHTYNVLDGIEVLDARGTPPPKAPRIQMVDPSDAGSACALAPGRSKPGAVWT